MKWNFHERDFFIALASAKALENTWAKALSEGKEVKVNIQPSYVGDSVRPDKFYVEYTIDGGRPIEETFKNAPGGK